MITKSFLEKEYVRNAKNCSTIAKLKEVNPGCVLLATLKLLY